MSDALRVLRRGFVVLLLGCTLAGLSQAQQLPVTIERDVPAKMRDGVVLRADIYRPRANGKYPVLLQRTPYNKGPDNPFGHRGATKGYVVIFQDVRGRFASEGEWYPFKYEADDGYDTVEWAAALPYVNGQVAMFGTSYPGIVQKLAAIARPPHLVAIFPVMATSNRQEGGAATLSLAQLWTTTMAIETLTRRIVLNRKPLEWAQQLPLVSFSVLEFGSAKTLAPYYFDWLDHPTHDDYWQRWCFDENATKVNVPAYHLGGWYDLFTNGTLHDYMSVKNRGGSNAARQGQRLLMGPWDHGPWESKVGEVDFGPLARLDYYDFTFRYYDCLLKGQPTGIDREKPVKIFAMGQNVWREEDDWPLTRARNTRYYLHSEGKAQSLRGNGKLSTEPPKEEVADRYVYDPENPVPTYGGRVCCDPNLLGGPRDQRVIEAREDVLVYTTPPLEADTEITGFISLELYASSTAVDTDFTAKLTDVWPNGFAQILTDGIQRARYRISQEKPELMKPGQVYKLTIDTGATSNVFLSGHRLRLEVSSSNFPRFDRNLNTGEDQASGTRIVKATNTIYHDSQHPSAVVLPVVPR